MDDDKFDLYSVSLRCPALQCLAPVAHCASFSFVEYGILDV